MFGSPSQRRGLIFLLGLILVFLAIRLALNPTTVPDPQPESGPRSDQLADRIDPNTAVEAELAAIPTLGEKRAAAIVEYRGQYTAHHKNHPAFSRLLDLEQIPGIGAATAETMEPYLVFPAVSATRP